MNKTELPRLLWLTMSSDENLPSLRLRVLEIMKHLEGDFYQERLVAPLSIFEFKEIIDSVRAADVVIIQKHLLPLYLLLLLKLFSKKLVYDFDDAVYVRRSSGGGFKLSNKKDRRFKFMCKAADVVIAGNQVLKEKAQAAGAKNIRILPTAVECNPIPSNIDRTCDKVTLGWIGTGSNLVYLEGIESVLLNLRNAGYSFKLSVMANKAPEFEEFADVEFHEWAPSLESDFLASIDIGLMPLADNEHTRGKCAYKALQYMSYGKPVVVSDVGVNALWTNGAGYAVKDNDEMFDALRKLMESSDLRNALGVTGREVVGNRYSKSIIVGDLKLIVNELLTH